MRAGPPTAVVTGGGGGIGAAVAEVLGRAGWFVVTLDPLVSLDGAERLPAPAETTAARIVAAGGTARASSASVVDAEAVRAELEGLERLDAVVNVAGITRPTGFASGSEDDWRRVLAVHLDGYRNVLGAALPRMASAGRGRILGVTSGSGWRAADAGAYSAAKRAVAALTWQLGPVAPPGVAVNAMSPIAATRMVAAAVARSGGGSATGGLSLRSMPTPEEVAPLGAHLVGEWTAWCRGQVLFVGAAEAALIEAPRLLEVVRVDTGAELDVAGPAVLAAAEAAQLAGGGANPRLRATEAAAPAPSAVRRCLVVTDRADLAGPLLTALGRRGIAGDAVPPASPPELDGVDAVVVALGSAGAAAGTGWERVLAEHEGLPDQLLADGRWMRAVADHAVATDRPVRLVTATDATTSGGRSRAQAVAQLSRAGRGATGGRVAAHAVALEGRRPDAGAALVAYLVGGDGTDALAGAELVAGDGWVGLRSHPRPSGSIVLGDGAVPPWFDDVLREMVRP